MSRKVINVVVNGDKDNKDNIQYYDISLLDSNYYEEFQGLIFLANNLRTETNTQIIFGPLAFIMQNHDIPVEMIVATTKKIAIDLNQKITYNSNILLISELIILLDSNYMNILNSIKISEEEFYAIPE